MLRVRLILIACVLVFASHASAGPLAWAGLDPDDTAWFYNRPGATVLEVQADLAACQTFGARMMYEDGSVNYSQGLVQSVMAGIVSAGPKLSFADDCMMSMGYRRFNLPGENMRRFQARFRTMSEESQVALMTSEAPAEGVLTRQWADTYWLPREGDVSNTASRRLLPHTISIETQRRLASQREVEAVGDAGQIIYDPSTQAVVVLTLSISSSELGGIVFDHADYATGQPGFLRLVRRREHLYFAPRINGRDGVRERTFVYVLPPGTYALAAALPRRGPGTQFCLGTIALTIGVGDVVDLGRFRLEEGGTLVDPLAPAPLFRMRVDELSLDDQRRAILGDPALSAQMRAASFVNQFPRACRMAASSYGFDVPGAPSWRASQSPTQD